MHLPAYSSNFPMAFEKSSFEIEFSFLVTASWIEAKQSSFNSIFDIYVRILAYNLNTEVFL